jgi:hypothetical protein
VLFQVGGWDIVLIDKFVDVIFGEFRLQLWSDSQDMRDFILL